MSDMITQLLQMVENQVAEVNTTMPAVVESYDPATNRVVVRPTLPKRLANGEELPPPLIYNVPVQWTASQGGQAAFTFPLAKGDGVMLHFSQRSMEGWLSGKIDAPDDPRMHDLSDAIAVPGLMSSNVEGHAENVQLKFGKAFLIIKPDGTFSIGNDQCSLTFEPGGNITVHSPMMASDGDIKAGTITLKTHKHTGVQSGLSNTGLPTP